MHHSEIPKILEGDSDAAAIAAYRALKQTPEDIARLAAMMAPPPEDATPTALANAAVSLQTEAEAALLRRRETLVASMNYRTLLALASELNVLGPDEGEAKAHDPIAGPVARRLKLINKKSIEASRIRNEAFASKSFSTADARTRVQRPQIPCDLEPALRYAANAGTEPWQVVKEAFVAFLGVFVSQDTELREAERASLVKSQIGQINAVLAQIPRDEEESSAALAEARKQEASPERDKEINQHEERLKALGGVHREHEERLQDLKSELELIEQSKTFRQTFHPGAEIPAHVADEAAAKFARYWDKPESVWQEVSLAWLCNEFYPFWNEHAPAYLTEHEQEQESAKKRAAKASTSGIKGAEQRERNRWLERTRIFGAFVLEEGGMPARPEIPEFVAKFAKERAGVKHPGTRKKVQDFFGILVNTRNRNLNDGDISELLKSAGLPTGLVAVLCECREAFDGAIPGQSGSDEK